MIQLRSFFISLFALLFSAFPLFVSAQGMMGNARVDQGPPMMTGAGMAGMMNMMGGGMMQMAGTSSFAWGTLGLMGWLWVVVWTVNSVLVGMLLWVLIQRYRK